MKRIACALIASCCLTSPALASSTPRALPFQLEDVAKIANLSEPQISPDGKEIAVIVSRPNWEEDSEDSEIDLVDVASGRTRSLTFDRTGLDEPRWSPDGDKLAFIADAPPPASAADQDDPVSQVFVMNMHGGDPVRITNAREGIDEYAWSPDGTRIAFVTENSRPRKTGSAKYDDAFKVTDNNYTTRASVPPWHLWVVAAGGGTPTRLTQGPWSLDTDQGTITPLAWTPDGKSIAFTQFPDAWYGNAYRSIVVSVPAAGGDTRVLVSGQGSGWPAYGPGKQAPLAYMRARGGDLNNGNAVYVESDGKRFDATADLARNIDDFAWLPDGSLLLSGAYGTREVLWRQPLGGSAQMLDLGAVNASGDMSVSNNGAIAFIGSTADHPDELYVLDSPAARPEQLTDFNAFVDNIRLGRVASIDWKGPDGFAEDGVLTYPPHFHRGDKYPLVLEIHGGPEGASLADFSPLPQLLAARGFVVFQPNYRGSINLGDAYQHAIYRDTGAGPGKDVMAGLAAVEKLGIVDERRIGVSGWSYGGFMTSWLNGNYPKTWAAAVEGAALNDWVMDYTISFYQKGDLYFFGGSPWTSGYWDIWREQSPIAFARNVVAPTLILGDVGDPNVPIVNSYEMYHALRDNGVTTEFFAYPADTHFPHDIVRTTDVYRRWIDWMVKYLKPGGD